MAVNLPVPIAEQLFPVAGVRLGTAISGIHKAGRKDTLVIALAPDSQVAGVFTQNRFCAAPVTVCRRHLAQSDTIRQDLRKSVLARRTDADSTQIVRQGGLSRGCEQHAASLRNSLRMPAQTRPARATQPGRFCVSPIRALVVNTGNANAGTGETGIMHAQQTCTALAELLDLRPEQILPFSTGVILEPLPVTKLIHVLPQALSDLSENNWLAAAHAIMTTDTQPKAVSRRIEIAGQTITLTGISKGAGMIRPNMATMLAFIATDAKIAQPLLQRLVKQIADESFNCISVDGDTSTNDSFVLIASGAAEVSIFNSENDMGYAIFYAALRSLAQELAQMIVRDGEGATKFIQIKVSEGKDISECRQIAYAIAHSPLVKTAFFAGDPNLGRILAAIGYAGVDDLQVEKVNLWLDDVWVAQQGCRRPQYQEAEGQRVMQQNEITMHITLGRGQAQASIWTCDLSHEYVSINADYRS